MNMKIIGAVIVVFGCGGFGFLLAASQRKEEKDLRQLLTALDLIQNELEYRLTPLPELCCLTGKICSGAVGKLFEQLCRELEGQIAPDATYCMNAAVADSQLSTDLKKLFRELGRTLGRFDLPGQQRGIEAVRQEAHRFLDRLTKDKDTRLRGYQTLGLCAGAALAILLL